MTPIRTILVPIDFSENSDAALAQAIEFAKVFGASIHMVHSYGIPMRGVMPYEFAIPEGIWDGIREAGGQKLEELREKVASEGIETTAHLSAELPSDAIVAVAESVDANLIVMGTRGNTGFKHAFLGSVAERTLRTAPCPVLTVKHPDA